MFCLDVKQTLTFHVLVIISTSYLTQRRSKLPNVSGGKGFCWSRNCSFSNPWVGCCSMFIKAWLWRVTASSSSSALGGMSVSASQAASTEGKRQRIKHQHNLLIITAMLTLDIMLHAKTNFYLSFKSLLLILTKYCGTKDIHIWLLVRIL